MRDYQLTPAALGTFAQYDDQTASDPSIWNEFAAAAFRVGHSQVQGRLTLVSCFFFFCFSFLYLYSIFDLSQALRFQWRRSNGPVVHVELLLLRRFQVAGAGLHRQRHPGLNERSAAGHQSGIHFATNQLLVQVGPYYISWNENQLTNCVWKKNKRGTNQYGMDLVALNIQRGREHGIPDYNTVRAYCGLPKAKNFEELISEIKQEVSWIWST